MPEIVKCPKCGVNNAKVFVIDHPKGWKVGKRFNPGCGFWGKLEKLEAGPILKGKAKTRKKAKEAEPAPLEAAPPAGGDSGPAPKSGYIPNSGHRERNAKPWWDRDISEFLE